MAHVFISYAKKDTRDLALRLHEILNTTPGFTAWMDETLVPGKSWARSIEREIDRADFVVVLLSPDVNRPDEDDQPRSFVLNEIDYAQQIGKTIIPVMAQRTRQPIQIAGLQYIDLTVNETAGLQRLMKRLGAPLIGFDKTQKKSNILMGTVIASVFVIIASFVLFLPNNKNNQSSITSTPSPSFNQVLLLNGHRDDVKASFSHDGLRIVTSSADNTAIVWDAQTGQQIRRLEGHSGTVYTAAYNPDDTRIVTASADNTAIIWDAETGETLIRLKDTALFALFSFYSAVYSPDGAYIVTTLADGMVIIWDAETGKLLRRLEGHTDTAFSAAYSPDGNRIVTSSADNTAIVWDAKTGEMIFQLDGKTADVFSAAYSPNGQHIVTASCDLENTDIYGICGNGTIYIWDAFTGILSSRLDGHNGWVYSVDYSPNGEYIISASCARYVDFACAGGAAYIWDAKTKRQITRLVGHSRTLWNAAYSPDGVQILTASADGTVIVWKQMMVSSLLTVSSIKH